jgi:hypothetical protein
LPKKRKHTAVDLEDEANASGEEDPIINDEQHECTQNENKRQRKAKPKETKNLAMRNANTNAEAIIEAPSQLNRGRVIKTASARRKSDGQLGNNARRFSTRLRNKQGLS